MSDNSQQDEWKIVKFEKVVENIREPAIPEPEDSEHYIGLEHLDSGSLRITRWGSDVTLIGQKLKMKRGDILFARRNAYLRRIAIAPHDGLFSAHGMIMRPKHDLVHPDFLPFFLESDLFMERAIKISVGSLSPTINWSTLKEQEFSLPPLVEQKRIAEVLWAVEKNIEKTNYLLIVSEKYRNMVLDHLCSTRNNGPDITRRRKPAKSNIEGTSGDIKISRLGDLAVFKNGINFNRAQKGNIGVLTIDVKNMYSSRLEPRLDSLYRVNKTIKEDFFLKHGDILIVRSSVKRDGVGWATCFKGYDEPITYCGFIIRVRLTDHALILPEYLTYLLRSKWIRRQLIKGSGQAANTNIGQRLLSEILVAILPMSEQIRIVDVLQSFDSFIFLQKKNRDNLIELKRGLIQILLDGNQFGGDA